MSATSPDVNVLDVKGLQTVFFTNSGLFRAVDDVSFHVKRGASGNGSRHGGPANWDEFTQGQWLTVRNTAPAYPL